MLAAQEFAVTLGRLAANHLWQSTGLAAVAVVLALALRANSARARYGLWLAASVKFLIPFSVLAAMGGGLGRWLIPARPVARAPLAIAEIVQPFAPFQGAGAPAPFSVVAPVTSGVLPVVLLAIWLCGLVAVVLHWWVRWRRVAAAVRGSTPLAEGREVEALRRLRWGGRSFSVVCQQGSSKALTGHKKRWPVPLWGLLAPQSITLVSSRARLEPGVFGIFRPVLWLPAGIGDRLDDAELEAILAHELCHARRRDNLAAAVHMVVEAMFWFHPLVWWLGARLTEERERACDEEVVRMGGEPQVYAESILKVCEFYVASPVICAAGVTGGELKKRIEGIMTNRFTRKLSYGKKLLLMAAAVVALVGPILIGVFCAPRLRAQSQPAFEVASVKAANPVPLRSELPVVAGTLNTPLAQAQGQPPAKPQQPAAQSAPAPRPQFEVASVKVVDRSSLGRGGGPRTTGGPGTSAPGRFSDPADTMRGLLMRAFGAESGQIIYPDKNSRDFYEVVATMPPDTTKAQFQAMLQNLLVERFHLVVHHETRNFPAYELVIDTGGPKLREVISQPDDDSRPTGLRTFVGYVGVGNITMKEQTTEDLARQLGNALWSAQLIQTQDMTAPMPRVVDRTGLTGRYTFTMEFSQPGSPGFTPESESPAADLPDLFATLRKQLGLRLNKTAGVPVDVIVVDSVDKVPVAN